MLEVNIDKILPVAEAKDSFEKFVDEVETSDELYVFTKNGKPAAILVGVHHLEKLTGTSHEELLPDEEDKAGNPKENEASDTIDEEMDDALAPIDEPAGDSLDINNPMESSVNEPAPLPQPEAPIVNPTANGAQASTQQAPSAPIDELDVPIDSPSDDTTTAPVSPAPQANPLQSQSGTSNPPQQNNLPPISN